MERAKTFCGTKTAKMMRKKRLKNGFQSGIQATQG
jgi:hypothetical protein